MLCFPNYKKNIVNVISSIKKYYRIPTDVPSLQLLDLELNKMYKNVVLLVISGVGENMLTELLHPNDILFESLTDSLTSVFPAYPTTSLASCISGQCPCEHGRLGQTMFFKELCRTVELATNMDPYSGTQASLGNAADFLIPTDSYFGEIADSIIGGVQPFSIAMTGTRIPEDKSFHKVADTTKRLAELIKMISETDQNTFTLAHWSAVRNIAAANGCLTYETSDALKEINHVIEWLSKELTDTIIIVTSDHGMTDISNELMLNLRFDLMDCLTMPPSFGKRAVNFFVKAERRSFFERAFKGEFSEDFMLMKKDEVMNRDLLGIGRVNKKISDFMGDYLALAISDKTMKYRALNEKHKPAEKASFGGLTSDEMCLPLAVITTERSSRGKIPFFENITPKSFTRSI